MIIIKTSDKEWLKKCMICYSKQQQFELIDDAKLGINESDLESGIKLINAAFNKTDINWKEITSILVSLGISGLGIWIILIAVMDPEPTSKLTSLLTGGVILAITGGLGTLYFLGMAFNVKGKSGPDGFEFDVNPIPA